MRLAMLLMLGLGLGCAIGTALLCRFAALLLRPKGTASALLLLTAAVPAALAKRCALRNGGDTGQNVRGFPPLSKVTPMLLRSTALTRFVMPFVSLPQPLIAAILTYVIFLFSPKKV